MFGFGFREEAKAEVEPWRFGGPKVLRLEEICQGFEPWRFGQV